MTFTQSFVDLRNRNRQLGNQVDAHFFGTPFGDEITICIKDHFLAFYVPGIAVSGFNDGHLDRIAWRGFSQPLNMPYAVTAGIKLFDLRFTVAHSFGILCDDVIRHDHLSR
jgi:hypothetical protein